MPFVFDPDCFANDYRQARTKFLRACQLRGVAPRTFEHPAGGDQNPLATDVCWIGPERAGRVLVVISATHGVEGFCGSAAQIRWLRQEIRIPDDCAVMLVHALNPFGFAHCRRVNEDNVDLNRNFVDFSAPPDNPGYRLLADSVLPESRNDFRDAERRLADYLELHGQADFEQAVSGGQYSHPDGLFYGGSEPSWSRRLIETLFVDYRLAERQRLIVIDIHSGLGPYGYGEIISDHAPDSVSAALAKSWFGPSVTEPARGTSTSVPKQGLLDYAWYPVIGDRGCYITLEFGTYSVAEMFAALREENYCWQRNAAAVEKQAAQLRLRDFFYPARQDWQEKVSFRCAQVIGQALAGLSHD